MHERNTVHISILSWTTSPSFNTLGFVLRITTDTGLAVDSSAFNVVSIPEPITTTAQQQEAAPTNPNSQNEKITAAASVVGVAVGVCVAVLVLISAVVVFYFRRRGRVPTGKTVSQDMKHEAVKTEADTSI
jgi:hypothetical protein